MFFLEKRLAFASSSDVNSGDIIEATHHNLLRTDVFDDHHSDPLGTKISNSSVSNTADIEARKILLPTTPVIIEYLLEGSQLTNEIMTGFELPKAGYLEGISVEYSDAITAGSLVVRPTKDGVALGVSGLDITLNSGAQRDSASVSYGTTGYDYAADNDLGIRINTTTLAPLNGKLKVLLFFHVT